MGQLTRRHVLAYGSSVAAFNFTPISALAATLSGPSCLNTTSLKQFREYAKTQKLSAEERFDLVDQAIKLLRTFYVHLPLKRALYGVDPLERLRLLQDRLPYLEGDLQFHSEMRDIFDSLHDWHTTYYLPEPYQSAHAWLPFRVETCIEGGRRKYIVSRVADDFVHPTFKTGVELLAYNGVPVEPAAEAAGQCAATPPARHALGLARLTYRWLLLAPPPSEDEALLRYGADGREFDIRLTWNVTQQPSGYCSNDPCQNELQQLQKFRQFLYAPYYDCSTFGEVKRIRTADGDFGYIRIFSFVPGDDDDFVAKFKAYLKDFAANTKGVIIDVRDNSGGHIRRAERCLQFITPTTTIKPAEFYFIATPVTLQFCLLPSVTGLGPRGLKPYVPSILHALQNGGTFSDHFQYTSNEDCNEDPRWAFPGPAVVVTNALTLSAAEFFAAGFQDHGGIILGVDETTAGGGAHVRSQDELHTFFKVGGETSPFKKLGKDRGGFSLAFRRSVRVGRGAGMEIEDAGVGRNFAYAMTRDDLLHKNRDLKKTAATLLAEMI